MTSIAAEMMPVVHNLVRDRPDFCIIGHSKCGTTALHDMLAQHPQLFMSSPKEPNFFATDLTRPGIPYAFGEMSADTYRDLFADAKPDQLCGESSASNIYSKTAATEMAAWNPAMKLIAILREPIDFLVSYHQQMLKNPITDGESVKSLRRALELEPERKRGRNIPRGQRVPELLYYAERCRYREQLERVYQHFPREQVLVLIYDDFRRDNAAVLREVCEFLGVDPDFDFEPTDRNTGVSVRSKAAQNALANLSHGRGAWAPVKRVAKAALAGGRSRAALRWAMGRFAFGPKATVDDAFRTELRERFRGEVEAVSDLLGRDLVSEWGYGQP